MATEAAMFSKDDSLKIFPGSLYRLKSLTKRMPLYEVRCGNNHTRVIGYISQEEVQSHL